MVDSRGWIGRTCARIAYLAGERRIARENRRICTPDNRRSADDFSSGGSSAQDLHGSRAMTLPQSTFTERRSFSAAALPLGLANAKPSIPRFRQQSETAKDAGQRMIHLFINALAASAGGGLTYIRNVLPRLAL